MKRFILPAILICCIFLINSGYKWIANKEDSSFEWRKPEAAPKRVLGAGKILDFDISTNKKYIAILTSTGIEIFDFNTGNFLKKLMLYKRVSKIAFRDKDEFLTYKIKNGKIINWGIFNFSFKQINKISSTNAAKKIIINGFKITFKKGNIEKTILRKTPYFYRFSIKNNTYNASATKHGVIYEFTDKGNRHIKDKLYNYSGKLIDISKNNVFALIKNNGNILLVDLRKINAIIRKYKKGIVKFSKKHWYFIIRTDKNSIKVENFRGKVSKQKTFKKSIKNVFITKHGIGVISDKVYFLDFSLKIIKEIKINNVVRAYKTAKGYVLAYKISRLKYAVLLVNNGRKKIAGYLNGINIKNLNGTIYFKYAKGIKVLFPNKNDFVIFNNAQSVFKILNKKIVVSKNELNLIKNNKLKNLHIKIPDNFLINKNSIFFMKSSVLHSLKLSKNDFSFLLKLSPELFIKKAENYTNVNAKMREYLNLLNYFDNTKKALKKVAAFFYKINDYNNSLRIYKKLITNNIRDYEVFRGAGISSVKLKKYRLAVLYLKKALPKFSKDYLLYYYLGTAYYNVKAYGPAIRYLQLSIKFNKNFMKSYQNLGLLYQKIRRYKLAENIYFQGITINEASDELYFNLGRLYEIIKKLPLALMCYKKSFNLKNKDYYYAYQIAQIYIKIKKWNKALNYLKQTVRINPDYSPAQFNLGWIYEKIKKNKTLAKYHYKFFLELEPGSRYKRRIMLFLKQN